jgi:hypothetical protein
MVIGSFMGCTFSGKKLSSGSRLSQFGQDHTQYVIGLFHYITVPETQHPVACFHEEGSPIGIVLLLVQVLTAVHFDNQFSAWAAEIGYVRPNCMLPAEGDPEQVIADVRP